MNLVAAELGLGAFAGDDDGAACGIYFDGVAEGGLDREAEDLDEHLDHVVVGVLVIVEQHDVEKRGELFALLGAGFGQGGGSGHFCSE